MRLTKRQRMLRTFRASIRARAFKRRVFVNLAVLFDAIEQRLETHTAWQAIRSLEQEEGAPDLATATVDQIEALGVRTIIRVADFARDDASRSVAVLLQWVDLDEADPVFSRLVDPEVRIPDRHVDEGRTRSAHLVFAMDPSGDEHTVLLEDATMLSPTRVTSFLKHMMRQFDRVTVEDPGSGRTTEAKVTLDLEGVPETKLKDELEDDAGLLNSIEIVRRRPIADRIDEPGEFEESAEVLRFKPVRNAERGAQARAVINKLLGRARDLGFEKIRVRYTTPGRGKKSVTFDANVQDALERAFVTSRLVELDEDLPECVGELHPRIVEAARAILDG